MTSSLNGWPCPPEKLVTLTVPGTKRRLTLCEPAAPILVALAADYHKAIAPIDVGPVDEGGYNDRDARLAPGRKSNHASGTAIDLNWSGEGAQGSSAGRRYFAKARVRLRLAQLKARYGRWVQWGGDWKARDYMHWEIKPGVTALDLRAARTKLGINAAGERVR